MNIDRYTGYALNDSVAVKALVPRDLFNSDLELNVSLDFSKNNQACQIAFVHIEGEDENKVSESNLSSLLIKLSKEFVENGMTTVYIKLPGFEDIEGNKRHQPGGACGIKIMDLNIWKAEEDLA
jgi:hypothetical protein